jgi:glycosyltransferase involved in cell wall biosynthesis
MPSALFLSPHSDPEADLGEPDSGGQCVYEHQLAQALAKKGWDVTTFCRQVGKREDLSIINEHYRIHRISCGPEGFVPKEEIAEFLPEFIQKMQPLLPQEPYVIHGHYWDGGKASLYLRSAQKNTTPLVWTPHSLGSMKREKFPGSENEFVYNFIPRLTWENYSCFAADQVIVSSPLEKNTVIEKYGYDEDKIAVIPPGIDWTDLVPHDKEAMRNKYGLPQEGKILLCLGRMTRSKGYHHAIRALSWLKEQYTDPVSLVICGGSDSSTSKEENEYKQYLRQVTEELHLQESVFFLPAIAHEKVAEIYSAADIFIMSSENEPFGLTVLESMIMGLPVVASNTGGPTFLIQHNFTGSLVTIYNPRRVAHYIYSYFRDPQFTQRVMKNARDFAIHEFDWKNQALRFADVYENVTRHSQAPDFKKWMQHNHFLRTNLELPV